MPETFTWSPQKGFTVSRAPNVAVVKLGDGYEQCARLRAMRGPFASGPDDKCQIKPAFDAA